MFLLEFQVSSFKFQEFFMIFLPNSPKIIEKTGDSARFEIEGLYPGYGVTIGNTLRRVLLSSLSGAAVTQLKIKGANHEFATIDGVLEDVVTIMLNLKQLRFKIYTDEPQKAILKVKGEKEVKGSDFKLSSQVELINKDAHVATITDKKTELEIEILIKKGLGYESVERRKEEKLGIGEIPLDAIYTPVRKLSYHVENMRVGKRVDFDRLILEMETDGTITPEEAFSQASEILVKHFLLFSETFDKARQGAKENRIEKKEKEKKQKGAEKDINKILVEDLKFSKRILTSLLKNNIKTIGGILRKNEQSLLELEGMGDGGIKEIKKVLKKFKLDISK